MTIRHLKTFIAVYELNSISKAAESLFVAQPSVSQTIKELEEYYNVSLFERINKRLVVTEDGKYLYEKAKAAVSSFEDFEFTAFKKDISPKINVGLSLTFGQFVLPSFMHVVAKEISNVDPYFYVDKTKGIEEKILLGQLDFAIVEGHITSNDIKAIKVGQDRLVCVAGNDYPIEDKINIESIINHKLLLREKDSASRKIIDNILLSKGIKITRPRMESNSNSVILSMVINNNGIAILPEDVVKLLINKKIVRRIDLDVNLNRDILLICLKNKEFTNTAKKAYDACERLVKDYIGK